MISLVIEPIIGARLIAVDAETYPNIATVRALLADYDLPTTNETNAYLAEALSDLSDYTSKVNYFKNPLRLSYVALGDATEATAVPEGAYRDIIIPSAGSENITVKVKTVSGGNVGLQWYNPWGVLLDSYVHEGNMDWTDVTFAATDAGNYVLRATRMIPAITDATYIDVQNRPAAYLVSPRQEYQASVRTETPGGNYGGDGQYIDESALRPIGANSMFFYVPEGTETFTFGVTAHGVSSTISGTLTDPDSGTHAFGAWTGTNQSWEMDLDATGLSGLWKIDITTNNGWANFWFRGIPPLVWHDPEYLLIEDTP